MIYKSLKEICEIAERKGLLFWEVVLRDDCKERNVASEESFEQMRAMYRAMIHADEAYTGTRKSNSGMVGGDGKRLETYVAEGKAMSGSFIGKVMERAVKMGESNACMRKIVAAPTAGACGVLPAVLVPLYHGGTVSEEEIIKALYVASGIGAVISFRACIAGAAGGCQAEIGSASAMAAGALVALRGGNAAQIGHAAAMTLKNLMGLVCDPVAGLVEVPCVKRNVVGAMNAVSCADMAMAGIESRIPVDEVIDCMGDVGSRIPMEMRETALGGLAVTPTGLRVKERLKHN